MAVSNSFSYEVYMANKLAQLEKAEPTAGWDMVKLVKAFADAGFVGADGAEKHFEQYGQYEEVAPNAFFNPTEYYRAKAAQFYGKDPKAVTELDVASMQVAIKDAGMSAWSHYEQHGSAEGVNPSNSFNTSAYLEAKLEALKAAEPTAGWDMAKLNQALRDAGLSALEHFMIYAGTPGEVAEGLTVDGKIPAAFAVPEDKKVNPGGGNGQTFQLTTGVDTFVGTVLEDTFVAAVDGSDATLTAGDTLDGGAGRDTLKVHNTGGTFTGVTVKNIETFEINGGLTPIGGTSASLDASLYAGLDTVSFVNVGESSGATLSMLTDGFTVGFTGAASLTTPGSHKFSLSYVDSATTANLTTTNLNGQIVAAVAGKGLTDLNITGNTNAALTNGLGVEGSTLKTVKIASTGGNYALEGTNITTVDASASTGDLYLELNVASTAKTVKTGAGDDEVWMKLAQLNKGDVIDLGGGEDMLGVTIASGGTTITADQYAVIKAAGAETVGFFINDAGAATTTINAASVGGKDIFLNAKTANGSVAQVVTLNNVDATQTVTSELQHGASSGANLVITSNESTRGTLNVVASSDGDTLNIANTSVYGTLNLSGAGDVVVAAAAASSVKIDGHEMSGTLTATGSNLSDSILGGTGHNVITGGSGADTIDLSASKGVHDAVGLKVTAAANGDTIKGFEVGTSATADKVFLSTTADLTTAAIATLNQTVENGVLSIHASGASGDSVNEFSVDMGADASSAAGVLKHLDASHAYTSGDGAHLIVYGEGNAYLYVMVTADTKLEAGDFNLIGTFEGVTAGGFDAANVVW